MPVTTPTSLRDLNPADVVDAYDRRGLATLPDAELVDAAAQIVAEPKAAEPDSFVLHAPLELLARTALLHGASADVRDRARQRIVWVAATYEAAGPAVALPHLTLDDVDGAVAALRRAIADSDPDVAGAVGRWLGRRVDPLRLIRLVGDEIVPSLAAAAHGPIFLHLLPRVAPRSSIAGSMFGSMAREVARHPDWALTWMDGERRSARPVAEALANTPVVGPASSTFIHPTMSHVETIGVAAEVAGSCIGPDVDIPTATVALQRIATASMLLDDPAHAPYGWSHCLTIPQAVASIAPLLQHPDRALAVAATEVVGFRATTGKAPLATLDPGVGTNGLVATLPGEVDIQRAIDHAAVHPDAHLAKYVVACLDAARSDSDGARQHLAAAAHLSEWWRQLPMTDDPLLSART